MKKAILTSIVGLTVVAAAHVALGIVVARTAIYPGYERKRNIRILGLKGDGEPPAIVLARSRRTVSPGIFSLWFDGGHAQLGEIIASDTKSVTRSVLRVDGGDLAAATSGSWSGYVYISPTSVGIPFTNVEIPTTNGNAPAWRFDPLAAQHTTQWAIHIHGLGSSRAGMLRGVRAASDQGMVSLVISYRDDGEGPRSERRQSTLGRNESLDVQSAVKYAVDHGATEITVFGWSMGANLALNASVSPWGSAYITRVISVSPVLDWKGTLKANCRRAHLPALGGSIAFAILNSRIGSRSLGLPKPLELREFNWLRRAGELNCPILIIHGAQDRSTPIMISERLKNLRPDLVTVAEFDSDHTLEWNSNPARWDSTVSRWLARHP